MKSTLSQGKLQSDSHLTHIWGWITQKELMWESQSMSKLRLKAIEIDKEAFTQGFPPCLRHPNFQYPKSPNEYSHSSFKTSPDITSTRKLIFLITTPSRHNLMPPLVVLFGPFFNTTAVYILVFNCLFVCLVSLHCEFLENMNLCLIYNLP